MPRLIMLFGALIAIAVVLGRFIESGGLNRGNTYRPRGRGWAGKSNGDADGSTFIVSRAELAGVRDSFSAEPIDSARAIMRCPGCQAFYHADSVATLSRENRGKCVNCSSTAFDPVQVVG